MGEMFGGHELIRFDDFFNVGAVDSNGNTHDHVLRAFGDFAIDSQEIRTLC